MIRWIAGKRMRFGDPASLLILAPWGAQASLSTSVSPGWGWWQPPVQHVLRSLCKSAMLGDYYYFFFLVQHSTKHSDSRLMAPTRYRLLVTTDLGWFLMVFHRKHLRAYTWLCWSPWQNSTDLNRARTWQSYVITDLWLQPTEWQHFVSGNKMLMDTRLKSAGWCSSETFLIDYYKLHRLWRWKPCWLNF